MKGSGRVLRAGTRIAICRFWPGWDADIWIGCLRPGSRVRSNRADFPTPVAPKIFREVNRSQRRNGSVWDEMRGICCVGSCEVEEKGKRPAAVI